MAKRNENNTKAALTWVLTAFISFANMTALAAPDLNVQRRDSVQQQAVATHLQSAHQELPDIRHRMMTSPQPVEIRQQGRNLCVTSRYNQLLPIYSVNGSLYSSFRLNKGTNWLSGLPKGSYIINNKKFTIN